VLVDFPPEVLEKLVIGDKVLVKAFGVILKLLDFPGVKVMNMDPRFLDALGIRAIGDKLEIPVTHVIPAAIMGSGLGANQTYTGDYDIQLFDEGICRNMVLMISDSAILWPFSMLTIRMEELYRKGAVFCWYSSACKLYDFRPWARCDNTVHFSVGQNYSKNRLKS